MDDLHADNVEKWSSWGCINQAYAWYRQTENEILAAERFDAVACGKGLVPDASQSAATQTLDNAWKNLLRTQDHMTFGPVDYSHQVPPVRLKPGEEKLGQHRWGYRFEALPQSKLTVNIGGMENYAEEGTPNYGGPRILTTRYEKVQQLLHSSHTDAARSVARPICALVVSGKPAVPSPAGLKRVCVFNPLGSAKRDMVEVEAGSDHGVHRCVRAGTKSVASQVISQESYSGRLHEVAEALLRGGRAGPGVQDL